MMVSFCAVLFSRDVLDEILGLIGSVSEGFLPTLHYSWRLGLFGHHKSLPALPFTIV